MPYYSVHHRHDAAKLTDDQAKLRDGLIASGEEYTQTWHNILMLDPNYLSAYIRLRSVPIIKRRLSRKTQELVLLAIDASCTHLFTPGIHAHTEAALKAGATKREVMETLELTSVLGVHAVNVGAPLLQEVLEELGTAPPSTLSAHQTQLKADFERQRGYWHASWDPVLTLSPDFFEAYTNFSSVPFQADHSALDAKTKELIYCAIDCATTHLYQPGLKLHIRNAMHYGASAEEVMEVFELAALMGVHTVMKGADVLVEAGEGANTLSHSTSPTSSSSHGTPRRARASAQPRARKTLVVREPHHTLPKARKTLVIREPHHTKPSRLLGLPRELRDITYRLVLVEAPLWDKRHKVGCPARNPSQACERPVYRMRDDEFPEIGNRYRLPWPTLAESLSEDKLEVCENLCRYRQGLSLRQANKQIRDETEEIFWSGNVFCYDHGGELVHDLGSCHCFDRLDGAYFGYEGCMPESAKSKVRRLSFREALPWYRVPSDKIGRVLSALQALPNLMELELPARFLNKTAPKDFARLDLPYLATVRAGRFDTIVVDAGSTKLDVYFSFSVTMPDCHRREHREDLLRWSSDHVGDSRATCSRCWNKIAAAFTAVRDWPGSRDMPSPSVYTVHDIREVARQTLEAKVPSHPADADSYTMTVCLPDGARQQVNVYGLPILDQGERQRHADLKRKEELHALRARCSNARKVRKQPCVSVDLDLAEDGPRKWASGRCPSAAMQVSRGGGTGDHGRSPRTGFQQEAAACCGQPVLAARQGKREETSRLEKHLAKTAKKSEQEATRQSMEQLALDRKAARKRICR